MSFCAVQLTGCLAACRFLENVRPAGWNPPFLRIGVHVRANDMLLPSRLDFGFTVPGTSYFSQAANYLIANLSAPVQLIVTSDSPDWTKKYIALESVFRNRSSTSVVYSGGGTTGFDMALLASCDALILSTGTYGWWAAWLANKLTVYYRYWPRPGSRLSAMFSREDYFPPHWIGMGNESDLTRNAPTNSDSMFMFL